MSIWGVGLKFAFFSALYFALALVVHCVWYPLFVIQGIPYAVFVALGLALIAIGAPIWILSACTIDRAYDAGILATQGIYALCRHPLYGNTIFYTIPGIMLFFRSWLLLSVPIFMYVLCSFLIRQEEEHLKQKFGPAYLMYEKQANALFPKVWKIYNAFWYPVPTGQVAENVYAVQDRDVNMFFYTNGKHTIAVDAAYSADTIRAELTQLPIDPSSVTHLFLTHTDIDHVGGLELFANAHIYLSEAEEQMINGATARFLGIYHNSKLSRAYVLLNDGDIIYAGDIKVQVVATPGHTPGSMSLLINDSVLFAGDTLVYRNNQAQPFYRLFNMDTDAQIKSIKKLAALQGIELLCTGHTGCTKDDDQVMKYWQEKDDPKD
ncbi:MAG: MBL fold metallo-hydrolase [Anaerolineae bacterium]|nr:MBL fold metallo-hydrolase [Anaerolineae bacterium]